MKAVFDAVLNDGDIEFAADFSAPWIFVGGSLAFDGGESERGYVALQREDGAQAPFGTLRKEGAAWRGELRLASEAFELLLRAYFSPVIYQISLSLDCEPGADQALEREVGMMDVALTRFEPEGEAG